MTEAMKETKGKARLDLIPWPALKGIAEAIEYGSKKYEEHDWRKGQKWAKYGAAACRHIFKWLYGYERDPESNIHHLHHAGACIVMLITWVAEKKGTDDRHKEQTSLPSGTNR